MALTAGSITFGTGYSGQLCGYLTSDYSIAIGLDAADRGSASITALHGGATLEGLFVFFDGDGSYAHYVGLSGVTSAWFADNPQIAIDGATFYIEHIPALDADGYVSAVIFAPTASPLFAYPGTAIWRIGAHTGDISLPAITTAASGIVDSGISGSGGTGLPAITLSGYGARNVPGAIAISAPSIGALASGEIERTGAASLIAPAAIAEGQGQRSITGSVTVSPSAIVIDGSAERAATGGAAIHTPPARVSGNGFVGAYTEGDAA
ncbi:hypothetical protein SAMN06265173_1734, partial [Thalassovita litoralis]